MSAEVSAHSHGLLDTGVIIARSSIAAATLPEHAAISVVTLAELGAGVHAVSGDRPGDSVERARRTLILQQVEHEFDPFPFDADAARSYATLCAAVLAIGRKPRSRSLDLMIAATAAVESLPLYTTNPGDFLGVEDFVEIVPVVPLTR